MFSSYLSHLFFGPRSRRLPTSQRLSGEFRCQSALESRRLLAGQVTAQLIGGNLHLVGDAAANDLKIVHTTAGIVVQGITGTTINGASSDFVAFPASTTSTGVIIANLGAGDDKLHLDSVTLGHHLIVIGGAGNDTLGLSSVTARRGVDFFGQEGNDSLVLESSTINGHLTVLMGAGDDLASLTNSNVKKGLVMVGAGGADSLSLDNSNVGRWLIGIMNQGSDDIRLANGTTTKHVQLWGGEGADVVQLNASTTSKSFYAHMGQGDDTVSLVGAVTVNQRFVARGGLGTDSISTGTATLPSHRIIRNFENTTVASSLLAARIGSSTTTGLLADVKAARDTIIAPTFVRVATSQGNIDFELFAADAPETVANFLDYLTRYEGSIVHRSARNANGSAFIVQGGGFDLTPTPVHAITKDAAIANEFNARNSNLRGTLSMALPSGNPAGGTSEWFVNTADNTFLDNARHTVFGRVLGTGMTVVDTIHAVPSFNISGPTGISALTDTPLDGYTAFTTDLTGTVNVTSGTKAVTGVGTLFTTELQPEAAVQIDGVSYTVSTITDATHFTIKTNATATVLAGTAKKNVAPLDSQYVTITSVTVIANPA